MGCLEGGGGVGNIAGVATAIALGGPGSLFWMSLSAILGGASAFAESTLAQIYKRKINGEYRGGIPYYIEKGLRLKWLAVGAATLAMLCYAALFPSVQSNNIASSIDSGFGIPEWVTGLVLVGVLAAIIFGGTKRIVKAAETMVPFMAIGYIGTALLILGLNYSEIPAVFSLVISSAFGTHAVFGGIIGSAIAWGVRRSLFSNVAGVGEGTYSSAAAEVSHPAKQGLVQGFSIYIDTVFVCMATGFMILITGMYNVIPQPGMTLLTNIEGVEPGPAYTQMAIDSTLPGFGAGFVAVAILFFAFTTLVAFYYIAETNLRYLCKNGTPPFLLLMLKLALLAITYYGSVESAEIIWGIGDIGYGLLAWVNMICILLLARPVIRTLRDYDTKRRNGLALDFDPRKLGIHGAEHWESPTPTIERATQK